MIEKGKKYAVLTGDLVKSSSLTSEKSKKAIERLKKLSTEIDEFNPGTVIGQIDTFRYDSWQLLLENPESCLKIAVFIRVGLKMESDTKTKYDTRISIGIGGVETLAKKRISNSRGPAFTYSGKGLDTIGGQYLAFMYGNQKNILLSVLKHGLIPMLDCIVGDWTAKESRAIYNSIKGLTQEETAQKWPPDKKTGKTITRQAVGDALIRAHWNEVNKVLEWIETEIKQAIKLV